MPSSRHLGKFCNYIPFERCGVDDVIVRHCCIEQRETVMVPCSETDVFRSGGLDGTDPLAGIEGCRIESACSLCILLSVRAVIKIPLTLGKHAVDTPMKEDSESHILEILTGGKISGSRDIILLGSHRDRRRFWP